MGFNCSRKQHKIGDQFPRDILVPSHRVLPPIPESSLASLSHLTEKTWWPLLYQSMRPSHNRSSKEGIRRLSKAECMCCSHCRKFHYNNVECFQLISFPDGWRSQRKDSIDVDNVVAMTSWSHRRDKERRTKSSLRLGFPHSSAIANEETHPRSPETYANGGIG